MEEHAFKEIPSFYDGKEYKCGAHEWICGLKTGNGIIYYYPEVVEVFDDMSTLLFKDSCENGNIFDDEIILLCVNRF